MDSLSLLIFEDGISAISCFFGLQLIAPKDIRYSLKLFIFELGKLLADYGRTLGLSPFFILIKHQNRLKNRGINVT